MKKFFTHRLLRFTVGVLLFGAACGQALADGELQNGDFISTWRMKDLAEEQLIPKYWFASEPETTGNPWVKIMTGDQSGVEIKAGESSRYLYQDVRIDGTQAWTLRWKCKGQGAASVGVVPRDDDGNIYPGVTSDFQLTDLLEEDEMVLTIPPETTIIRLTLAPRSPDSTVIFQEVELISSPN